MPVKTLVRRGEYHDSVRLMQLSGQLRTSAGVEEAMVMMATPNNCRILAAAGLLEGDAADARADDLVIAIRAEDSDALDAAVTSALEKLQQRIETASQSYQHRSLDTALRDAPEASLALISVPGIYAVREARRALEAGLNVMMFSDNVPLEDEVSLKLYARSQNLLLMGPDCGTAIIDGVGLGFANRVERGKVGIIGASGTGMQEIICLLDSIGIGISQAIGTGGRDLSIEVGGITMLMAFDRLLADPQTEVICLTSKPPSAEIASILVKKASESAKPVVINFLGCSPEQFSDDGGDADHISWAGTLEQAAEVIAVNAVAANVVAVNAAAATAEESPALPLLSAAELQAAAAEQAQKLDGAQQYVRALYAGGTLCYEALLQLQPVMGPLHSNLHVDGVLELADSFSSQKHTLLDMGEDEFTAGRAHPMIDSSLRHQRIIDEAGDPDVAVLLLDLVIGEGAVADPAGELVPVIRQARDIAAKEQRWLPVVVHVCGTRADKQSLAEQVAQLMDADVMVAATNCEAIRLAAAIVAQNSISPN